MRLVDTENLSLDYSGLTFISPYDYVRTAAYFARQINDLPEVEAVPCNFIRECVKESSGAERTYYSKLLRKWEDYEKSLKKNK